MGLLVNVILRLTSATQQRPAIKGLASLEWNIGGECAYSHMLFLEYYSREVISDHI